MTESPLDIEQPGVLAAYLRAAGLIAADEDVVVRILAGGVSNRTLLVERPNGTAWVVKQALAKLRTQVEWFSDPERIHREAAGLHWLARLAPPGTTTPLVFEDHAYHLLGMEAVPQPHANWKELLLAGEVRTDHFTQWGRLLGTIHTRAYAQRAEVAPAFDDRSFFESLRVEPYYRYTATVVPGAARFYADLIDTTLACRMTLVHGDYSPKNVLVYRDRLVLLDHEVIHFGDPAFDLGFSLAHVLSKAHHLPDQRAALADAAGLYWTEYTTLAGANVAFGDLEARAIRHTLGCLLARVAGRSTLEYLDTTERTRQQAAVLELMSSVPDRMPGLIQDFVARIACL